MTRCWIGLGARWVLLGGLIGAVLVVPGPGLSQQPTPAKAEPAAPSQPLILDKESFLTPPKEIADAVNALGSRPLVSLTNLSPDGRVILQTLSDGMPPLERVGHPHIHLAGIALDPVAHRTHDLWVRSATGFNLIQLTDRRTVPVSVPTGARVSNPVWSPDGTKLAYLGHFVDATHVFVANTETGVSRQLTQTPVLATLTTSLAWSRDGKQIQTILRPDDGKRQAPAAEVAKQPKVRVARPGPNPSRVIRFLLESPQDAATLEYLATGQVALIDATSGQVTKVGKPDMIQSVTAAPGEAQFRVAVMKKPFSYYVLASSFGSKESIWDKAGQFLATLNDRNLRETPPTDPTTTPPATTTGKGKGTRPTTPPTTDPKTTMPPTDPTMPPTDPTMPPTDPTDPDAPRPRFGEPVDPNGKRDIAWRPDGQGLSFLQLEPAKTKDEKEVRADRVMLWVPPFGKDDVKTVYSTPTAYCRWPIPRMRRWCF